jgi:hypothetical protein
MAKLVFIPDWLREDLQSTGTSFAVLDENLTSTIVSQVDVINYHKAQIEFFNFLTRGKEYGPELYLMYNSLFAHPLPDMPELEAYLQQGRDREPNPGLLASGVGEFAQITFTVDTQSEGASIYIIGGCGEHQTQDGVDKRYTVITDMLAVMHNRLRIQNGAVDKSSVFRDNPSLTTLYVESIPC